MPFFVLFFSFRLKPGCDNVILFILPAFSPFSKSLLCPPVLWKVHTQKGPLLPSLPYGTPNKTQIEPEPPANNDELETLREKALASQSNSKSSPKEPETTSPQAQAVTAVTSDFVVEEPPKSPPKSAASPPSTASVNATSPEDFKLVITVKNDDGMEVDEAEGGDKPSGKGKEEVDEDGDVAMSSVANSRSQSRRTVVAAGSTDKMRDFEVCHLSAIAFRQNHKLTPFT